MESNNPNDFYKDIEPKENVDLAKKRKIKYTIIAIVSVFLVLAIFYYIGTSEDNMPTVSSTMDTEDTRVKDTTMQDVTSATPKNTQVLSNNDNKTIDSYNPQLLVSKSSGYCSALAPQDWIMESDSSGRGVDIYNSDQSVGAGWFIAPILYDLYGEPDQAIVTIMQALGNEGYTFTDAGQQVDGGFIMRNFTATNQGRQIKGTGFYKQYPIDSTGYVLSYYQAAATTDKWNQDGGLATEVALSIRCTAQITPTADDGFSTSTSVSDTSDKTSLSDSWSEQAILGQETVHSPSTGETYSVSTSSYSDTGLQGGDPGYYRTVDSNGSVERLESGFGSY